MGKNNSGTPFTTIVGMGRHGPFIRTENGREVPLRHAHIGRYPVGTELTLKTEDGRYRVLNERRPCGGPEELTTTPYTMG
ncbi:MAG: hypothetical protein HYW25_00430 [Candidatus Aenigmarchaeota archaeon]|nr:hypothetical protein [Candidatus Aenigmarchaeota archaeon]